jgi:hypothetical protein
VTHRSDSEANAREDAMRLWVEAIAAGDTQRAAAAPLLLSHGLTYKTLLGIAQRDPDGWGAALEVALATRIGRIERRLYRIATNEAGDIADDPGTAKVTASTGQWLLGKWDRDQYGDHKRVDQTTTIVETPKDDTPAAIVDDAVSLMSDEEKADLLRRLQG